MLLFNWVACSYSLTHEYLRGLRVLLREYKCEFLQRFKCKLQKIEDLLRIRRLRWFGHAARMGNERLPTKMLTTQRGRECSVGRPRTSWRRVIRADLEAIECDDYPTMVLDCKLWRKRIKGPYTAQTEVVLTRCGARLGSR